MFRLASFNNRILPHAKISLPTVSAAALYGSGVFTTVAVFDGKPFLWHLHERRLRRDAAKMSLDTSEIDFSALENSLLELLAANKIKRARARITLFDSRAGKIWQTETRRKTDVLIINAPPHEIAKRTLNLGLSPFRVNSRSPLNQIKSCNYLENLFAFEAARKQHFDEAVRLNERDEIASTTMANIFWVTNKIVFTPALETGALNGTTRQFVLEATKKLKLKIIETAAPLTALESADEIFLTSAGLLICPIGNFGGKRFAAKTTRKLQTALFAAV
jgi:4-amino-4-deoxychorismate lyase